MQVTFLQDYKFEDTDLAVKVGDVLDLGGDEAAKLFGKGLVTAAPPEKKDDEKTPEQWRDETKALIAMSVKEALAEASKPKVPLAGKDLQVEVDTPEIIKEGKGGFKSFSHFAHDVYKSGAEMTNPTDGMKAWEGIYTKATGQGTSVFSEGGALVPDQFIATLLEKPWAESPLLSQVQQIPISQGNTIEIPYINETSRADGSRQGGIRVYRKAEATQYTASTTAVGRLKLHAQKLTGLVYVTDELIKFSAISIESILSRMFSREFQWKIVDEMLNGTGGMEMLGILNAACKTTVAGENGQAAKTIVAENLVNMWSRLFAEVRGGAVWLINQDCLPQLMTLTIDSGTGSTPVYLPPGGYSQSPYGTIFGRPVLELEQCKTLGTEGDIYLAAFSEYVYSPTPSGLEGASSVHLKFDYGETAFRFELYNDGRPWWSSYITPYSGSTNYLSPFVTLAVRA